MPIHLRMTIHLEYRPKGWQYTSACSNRGNLRQPCNQARICRSVSQMLPVVQMGQTSKLRHLFARHCRSIEAFCRQTCRMRHFQRRQPRSSNLVQIRSVRCMPTCAEDMSYRPGSRQFRDRRSSSYLIRKLVHLAFTNRVFRHQMDHQCLLGRQQS